MKSVIKPRSKKLLLLLLSAFIIVNILNIIYINVVPKVKEIEATYYQYTLTPSMNYTVVIKPNKVCSTQSLRGATAFPYKVIDRIDITYGICYQADKASSLNLSYDLVAEVYGYTVEQKEQQIYWSTPFSLNETKNVKMNANMLQRTEQVSIPIDFYNKFAQEAAEIVGLNLSSNLSIHMKGKVTSKLEQGDVEVPFDINLTAGLLEGTSQFVAGNLEPISNSLTKQENVTIPKNYKMMVGSIIFILFSTLVILYLSIFTSMPSEQQYITWEIKKILKNYGSRMVSLTNNCDYSGFKQLYVFSMKDLIKISDELAMPISYVIQDEYSVYNNQFFVWKDNIQYSYIVKHHSLVPFDTVDE